MNVRFWVFGQGNVDNPVKITLKPGQVVNHCSGGRTEEGWEHRYDQWSFHIWEGDRGVVYHSVETEACDCDGRIDHSYVCFCWADEVRDGYQDEHGIFFPKWQEESHAQRDYSAERMGY